MKSTDPCSRVENWPWGSPGLGVVDQAPELNCLGLPGSTGPLHRDLGASYLTLSALISFWHDS